MEDAEPRGVGERPEERRHPGAEHRGHIFAWAIIVGLPLRAHFFHTSSPSDSVTMAANAGRRRDLELSPVRNAELLGASRLRPVRRRPGRVPRPRPPLSRVRNRGE
jgi:hypothetical protein